VSNLPFKVLGVCGSTRDRSRSLTLLDLAISTAREAGAAVETLNLLETPLPLFRADGAYDRAYPEIDRVRALTASADAYVLVSPEYHGSMSGWMKNYLDFHYEEFAGKLFGLISATGGSLGESCHLHMRTAVQYCHGWSLPYHASAKTSDFDNETHELRNERILDRVRAVGRDLVVYGRLLKSRYDTDLAGNESGFAAWHRPR
jgi:NAD(P)H-dependent FMN reductase